MEDASICDLLIVIGTSLEVQPISELPVLMRHVPSILINRTKVKYDFGIELLGDSDEIVQMISCRLGWMQQVADFAMPAFVHPNKWVFSNESGHGTTVAETGRSQFLVTPVGFFGEAGGWCFE
jgi:hypothetical protein